MSRAFAKPVVVVSKCLEFEACRYNGERISASFIERLEPHVRFRPVCPEVEIGLGTPRDPIRIYLRGERKALYQPATRRHLTREDERLLGAVSGRSRRSRRLYSQGEIAVLRDHRRQNFSHRRSGRSRRPGAGPVRRGRARSVRLPRVRGRNRIERRRRSRGFPHQNLRPRRLPGSQGNQAASTASPATTRRTSSCSWPAIRRPCARWGESRRTLINANFGEVASSYEDALLRLLARTPSRASYVNALTHAMGHLSEKITKSDKARFLDALEEYREGRIPLDGPLEMLRENWTTRFGSEYLEKQTIFEPYPGVLGGGE